VSNTSQQLVLLGKKVSFLLPTHGESEEEPNAPQTFFPLLSGAERERYMDKIRPRKTRTKMKREICFSLWKRNLLLEMEKSYSIREKSRKLFLRGHAPN
jgi:hypothetical protein